MNPPFVDGEGFFLNSSEDVLAGGISENIENPSTRDTLLLVVVIEDAMSTHDLPLELVQGGEPL